MDEALRQRIEAYRLSRISLPEISDDSGNESNALWFCRTVLPPFMMRKCSPPLRPATVRTCTEFMVPLARSRNVQHTQAGTLQQQD